MLEFVPLVIGETGLFAEWITKYLKLNLWETTLENAREGTERQRYTYTHTHSWGHSVWLKSIHQLWLLWERFTMTTDWTRGEKATFFNPIPKKKEIPFLLSQLDQELNPWDYILQIFIFEYSNCFPSLSLICITECTTWLCMCTVVPLQSIFWYLMLFL